MFFFSTLTTVRFPVKGFIKAVRQAQLDTAFGWSITTNKKAAPQHVAAVPLVNNESHVA
jgi:hypothetical protein